MKPLRPYQQRSVDAVIDEWKTVNSTLLVLPTGTGKTRVAVEIIRQALPGRAIFVAHRQELIWQARTFIEEIIPDHFCEIEMGELYARHQASAEGTVIAMVQSLNSGLSGVRRMDRFNPDLFSILIIDEFHHSIANSYRAVINHFRRNEKLKLLGLTATPDRMDEEALGQVCESVAFDYEILDAINDGWLVPVHQVMVPVSGLDFSHVKTTAGDLNQAQLADVMESESNIQGVVQPVLETMWDLENHTLNDVPVDKWGDCMQELGRRIPRRTLIFTVSVKQAEMLSNIFNRVLSGISEWVCGSTPTEDRKATLESFEAGGTHILVNCNCFTEGFDSPGVELVVQARPTKSRALYAQQIGRATRPLPGIVDALATREERCAAILASDKPCCLVMDFVGNSGRHKLMSCLDILGGNVSEEVVSETMKMLEKLERPVNVSEAIAEVDEKLRQKEHERRILEEAQKARVVARTRYSTKFINPFDVLDITPARMRGWDDGKRLSWKQKNILSKQGVNPDTLDYAQGRQMVGEIMARFRENRCSLKQAAVLKRFNLPTDATRDQAKAWLDRIAANHWRRPNDLAVPQHSGAGKLPF